MAQKQSAEYWSWRDMNRRCGCPEFKDYKYYGARGITVCERWRGSFKAFIKDMGPRPTPVHTLDRKDNSGNYCPDNCRWATRAEQAANRRPWACKTRQKTSTFRGVSRQGGRWLVFFQHKFIGSFQDEVNAATAYNLVAFQAYGNQAVLNTPVGRLRQTLTAA